MLGLTRFLLSPPNPSTQTNPNLFLARVTAWGRSVGEIVELCDYQFTQYLAIFLKLKPSSHLYRQFNIFCDIANVLSLFVEQVEHSASWPQLNYWC